ncbi:DUF3035 domain-containing protein [Candidatus Pelagibacter sp.]|uniref:DUF3035 domain-containing protein n=1 Tax=Candidatus Pelagibacter sp. TaxID=2024849 RepID=UPI003F87D7A3
MRFIYNIFITLIASTFLFSCEGFKLKKKATSGEEFLIEKKDPLVLPPDFSKLPKPNEQPEMIDEEVNIISVFDGNQSSTEKDNNQNSSKSNIKKSISDKIQKQ